MNSCRNLLEKEPKLKITQTYNWLTDEEVDTLYEMAFSDYVMLRYPSENNRPSNDSIKIDFYISNWIYKRMVDILGRAGGISVTAYKENGLNYTYGGSYIDPNLASLVTPKASVPRWEMAKKYGIAIE